MSGAKGQGVQVETIKLQLDLTVVASAISPDERRRLSQLAADAVRKHLMRWPWFCGAAAADRREEAR